MRTTEARLLRREDVCLEDGIVNIRYSKGYNQHFVVLHDSMLELMKKYDVAISKLVPERIFFSRPAQIADIMGLGLLEFLESAGIKRMKYMQQLMN